MLFHAALYVSFTHSLRQINLSIMRKAIDRKYDPEVQQRYNEDCSRKQNNPRNTNGQIQDRIRP